MSFEDSKNAHEITTWRARPFVIGGLSFFLFITLLLAITGGLAASWTRHTWPPTEPVKSPVANSGWNRAGPQLQTTAAKDLQTLQQTEYKRLHTVHWTDVTHTYASIPIEQAMIMLSQAQTNPQSSPLLPTIKPESPIDLQNQKSGAIAPKTGQP